MYIHIICRPFYNRVHIHSLTHILIYDLVHILIHIPVRDLLHLFIRIVSHIHIGISTLRDPSSHHTVP